MTVKVHGQDGGYQKGVEWPEPRFSDHDDGTVTDNLTGLMWFKDTQYFEATMNWQNALDACESSELGEHTDWRLPNVNEL